MGYALYGPDDLAPHYQSKGFPRISPAAYSATIIAIFALAVLVASIQLFLRIRLRKKATADDYCLLFAIILSIASVVFSIVNRNTIYNQVFVGLGVVKGPRREGKVIDEFINFFTTIHTLDVLSWGSLFAIKFAYLMFFRPLAKGMSWMIIWWWILVSLLLPIACVCMFVTFYSCSDFTPNWINTCNRPLLYGRQGTILKITAGFDIVTDVLIITIPIILISRVQITLLRKIIITSILSLSSIMIVIQIIRVSAASLPDNQTDTVWTVFWCSLEASIAIIMVSLTSFKSIYGLNQNMADRRSPEGRPEGPGRFEGAGGFDGDGRLEMGERAQRDDRAVWEKRKKRKDNLENVKFTSNQEARSFSFSKRNVSERTLRSGQSSPADDVPPPPRIPRVFLGRLRG